MTDSTTRVFFVQSNDNGVSVFATRKASIRVGRELDNDLVLRSLSVSRRHAILHLGPTALVEDLASSNGTRVEGLPVSPREPAEWPADSRLEVGDAVSILRLVDASPLDPGEAGDGSANLLSALDCLGPFARGIFLSGLGAGSLVERLHGQSSNAHGLLLKVDCNMLSATADEGWLTRAFDLAAGGTLFLDNIEHLSLDAQTSVLDLSAPPETLRVGPRGQPIVRVQVVAATRKEPWSLVEMGRLHRDLLTRLLLVVLPTSEECSGSSGNVESILQVADGAL